MCWTSYVNLLRSIWYFGNISAFGHYYDLVRKKKIINLIEHIKVLQWPAQKLWSSCRTTSWNVWVAKQRNFRLFAAFLPDNGSFAWLWAFFISLLSILVGSKQTCCFVGCNTSKKPSQKMWQNWSERSIYKVKSRKSSQRRGQCASSHLEWYVCSHLNHALTLLMKTLRTFLSA